MRFRKFFVVAVMALLPIANAAYASVLSPSYDPDGTFTVSWDSGYFGPEVKEYKNGVYQRTITPEATATSVTISGRSDGIWKYTVRAEDISGGGGGEPLWAFVEKIKKNPRGFG
ncbi:hypothetical protein ACFR96_07720 [Microbulbifer halophilus]|uniref:Fibronectin type-III domain-containing protein n=1 Tax=Microbulbifer halophilus TaxID=453963 RepID=A0ABW5EI05_9GAMM